MKQKKVSSRYAKALFELSIETKQLEDIKNDIDLIYQVTNDSREFDVVLSSPIIGVDKKIAIFKAVFENKIKELTFSFIRIIVTKNRVSNLKEIAEKFIKLYKEYKGIKTAHLLTAVKIDNETRNKIIQIVKKALNSEIELVEKVNPNILGGFVLTVEDRQYDASIMDKIKELKLDFNINVYERKF
ncbi:MAG: ATP synthase F1 subunit delta [Bacteroidales bacterium]|nr:ATP synthase F1 subunit delta [Bacteroidales bacterium]